MLGRLENLWFRCYVDGYTLYFLYFGESTITVLLGTASEEVRKLAREAIEDVRRRALRELQTTNTHAITKQ